MKKVLLLLTLSTRIFIKISKVLFLAALGFFLSIHPLMAMNLDTSQTTPQKTMLKQRLDLLKDIKEGRIDEAKKKISANPRILLKNPSRMLPKNQYGKNTPLVLAINEINDELVDYMLNQPVDVVKQIINKTSGDHREPFLSDDLPPLCIASKLIQEYLKEVPLSEKSRLKLERLKRIVLSLLDAGADENLCDSSSKEQINKIKEEIKAVAKKAVKETFGGDIEGSIIGQYMVDPTQAQRAEDEKWEAERMEGIRKAAEKAAAKSLPKSSESSVANGGAESLDR